MLFSSSKCPLPALVEWCRSLRVSIGAGLDPIKIFKQQAKSGPRALRPLADEFARKLAAGDSLEDALEPHRDRFPPLFVELVAVGEHTGRLEDTFQELEQYYASVLMTQRDFRTQMMYPAFQFIMAVLIVSGLIFVLGMLGSQMDVLGIGLTGTSGALTFLFGMFGFVAVLLGVIKVTAENTRFRAQLEGFCLILPIWGPALLAFAVQRFAVALSMCAEAGLRAEKMLQYSFRASANSRFQAGETRAVEVAKRGGELLEAIDASGAPFPTEFRETLMTGEETGNMTEVMARIANVYREEAERRLKTAARATSWAIYIMVCIMIIVLIFSINSASMGARGLG